MAPLPLATMVGVAVWAALLSRTQAETETLPSGKSRARSLPPIWIDWLVGDRPSNSTERPSLPVT